MTILNYIVLCFYSRSALDVCPECAWVMYCAHENQVALEDDLYRENDGDSDGSEVTSELEFHLYSQLHYSSNVGEMEQQQQPDRGLQLQEADRPRGVEEGLRDTGAGMSTSLNLTRSPQTQPKKKKKEKREKRAKHSKKKKRSKTPPRSKFYRIEEVIVIDSSPDIISISEDEDGICSSKGRRLTPHKTSTVARKVRN